jgi:3-hydroxyisobutyrate dehydrogenase-like beta-hydroxyacid dehydrogenase
MSRRSRKNVGLIGLGIIGRRVAENLRRRGFHVFVWNRTPRPVPNFVGSVAEVAELCNVIQIFVADDEALREIIQQLSAVLTAHHIVLAHCTVAPESMQAAAEVVQRRGARFLDAPFTGSKGAAEKGELIYYVAGDDGALREARRFLEASSKEIVEFGEIGEATLVKVATNMVTAASIQVAAEALALVAKCGVTPEKFERALRSNASRSATIEMKLSKMMESDFEPHFSVKHMLKDLQIAEQLADSLELRLPVTEAARDMQLAEMRDGRGDEDYCCVVRQYFPDGVPSERRQTEDAPPKNYDPASVEQTAEPPIETPPEPPNESVAEASPLPAVVEAEPAPVIVEEAVSEAVIVETADQPSSPAPVMTGRTKAEERPGFLRRLFNRSTDY